MVGDFSTGNRPGNDTSGDHGSRDLPARGPDPFPMVPALDSAPHHGVQATAIGGFYRANGHGGASLHLLYRTDALLVDASCGISSLFCASVVRVASGLLARLGY